MLYKLLHKYIISILFDDRKIQKRIGQDIAFNSEWNLLHFILQTKIIWDKDNEEIHEYQQIHKEDLSRNANVYSNSN